MAQAAPGGPTQIDGSAGIPPTYLGFMWGWGRILGDGDAALRSFSALAGVTTVPLVYAVAAEFGQRRQVARLAGLPAWVGATAVAVVAGLWLVVIVAVARDAELQRPEWQKAAVATNVPPAVATSPG